MKKVLTILPIIIFNWGILSAHQPDPGRCFLIPVHDNLSSLPIPAQDSILEVRPFDLEIVPPSSGVQFYRNGILFLSYTRSVEKMTEKHVSFGALRTYSALISDTVPYQYMTFNTGSSVLFPSEATTFSGDYNTMYLSMIPENKSKENLFRADYKQDNWVIEAKPLGFCLENHIYTHPALSGNGKFMVFSSDLPGSEGGLDLFITRKENEEWSQPVNMGKLINTSGNELFASLDAENNLYFSSDGLPGQGGYDIFMCRYNGENWGKPQNLSSAINSQNDEVAFTINPADGKSAFFASRLKSAKNKTQLFRVTPGVDVSSGNASNLSSSFLAITGLSNEPPQTSKPVTAATAAEKPETISEPAKTTLPEKIVTPKPLPAKTETQPVKTTPTPEVKRDIVIYRVQILANTKPAGSYDITVAGKSYKTFEYQYMGAYRTTIGEFGTITEAVRFQNTCRQSGYNQAFVVAFKNNVRSNDPELFKR